MLLDAVKRYHEKSLHLEKELGCKEGTITDYGNFFFLKNGATKSQSTCGLLVAVMGSFCRYVIDPKGQKGTGVARCLGD